MSAAREVRDARLARHRRARAHVLGTADRPRLAVYRSLDHIYGQLIDDTAGRTLVAASSLELRAEQGKKAELSARVGTRLGERAVAAGIKQAVFDRGGFKYHGRVKAFADAARAAGLRF